MGDDDDCSHRPVCTDAGERRLSDFKTKDIVVNMYCNADLSQQLWFPVIQLTLLDIVTLICLLAVPSMCAWVVSSSGASEANGAIMRAATKAFMMKK